MVHLHGNFVFQTLVSAFIIVILKISFQSPITFQPITSRKKIHVSVFDTSPQAFNKYIVDGSSLAIHTEPDPLIGMCDPITEFISSKLATLISIEYFRCAVLLGGRL